MALPVGWTIGWSRSQCKRRSLSMLKLRCTASITSLQGLGVTVSKGRERHHGCAAEPLAPSRRKRSRPIQVVAENLIAARVPRV